VFDGHLCATDRLLYGAMPYPELIAFADSLASEAERLGARRGHAFAVTLRGQARLLSGQLDQADDDLAAGVREHQLIAAPAGEAIALQRRARSPCTGAGLAMPARSSGRRLPRRATPTSPTISSTASTGR